MSELGPIAAPDQPTTEGVPAVVKTVAIIRHLNAAPSTGRSLAEISGELGITKSHCHNILKTLLVLGWVVFDASRRRYTLGPRLLADISRLIGRDGRSLLIHEELVQLSLAARVPCVLTRVDPDGSFICVDKAEEAAELLVSVPIGHRFPPDAPAQMRIRLALASPAACREALRGWQPVARTPTTITEPDRLLAEIEATRARGYSISRGEHVIGVMSLAAPILDQHGELQLILQCPGVQADIEVRERTIAALLVETARRISVRINGAPEEVAGRGG